MGQGAEAESKGDRVMFGYSGVKDMFDGGGAGQSGSRFEGGGLLSSAANAVASPYGSRGSDGQQRQYSDADMQQMIARQQNPTFLQDMFNGGGMGAAGDRFKGAGLYSGLLNMLGVQPLGARDREAIAAYQGAQAAPQAVQAAIRAAQAPVTPMGRQEPPVAVSAAAPTVQTYNLDPFGDMMVRLNRVGIQPNYRPMPVVGAR